MNGLGGIVKLTELSLSMKGTKELGGRLLDAAIDKKNQAMQEAVVGQIQSIAASIDKYQSLIHELESVVSIQNQRLECIKKGEFTISTSNGSMRPRVVFTDEELNKSTVTSFDYDGVDVNEFLDRLQKRG